MQDFCFVGQPRRGVLSTQESVIVKAPQAQAFKAFAMHVMVNGDGHNETITSAARYSIIKCLHRKDLSSHFHSVVPLSHVQAIKCPSFHMISPLAPLSFCACPVLPHTLAGWALLYTLVPAECNKAWSISGICFASAQFQRNGTLSQPPATILPADYCILSVGVEKNKV